MFPFLIKDDIMPKLVHISTGICLAIQVHHGPTFSIEVTEMSHCRICVDVNEQLSIRTLLGGYQLYTSIDNMKKS